MESSSKSFLCKLRNKMNIVLKELDSYKWVLISLVLIHVLTGVLVSPLVTSDFERNLFYGEAFWKHGFRIYDMTPSQIDPDYIISDPTSKLLSYPNTTYDYPTIQLLFWAGVSLMPFSNVCGKWILSAFDVVNFFLIYSLLKGVRGQKEELELPEKGFALSYMFFSIPFSASEGQSTAITIFFLLLPLVLHHNYKNWSYLSIGLGFHWKYVSVLILPYLIIKDRNTLKEMIIGLIIVFFSIIILSFPLLFSNFILNYFGFFGRLADYSGQQPSNNLLLFHICISSLLSSGIFIIGFLHWLDITASEGKLNINLRGIAERSYWIPFLILLAFLKVYATAFPWYWMWFYPLLTIFPTREFRFITKLLSITFSIGIIDFVDMTIGIETLISFFI